jgi:hypothetical protein
VGERRREGVKERERGWGEKEGGYERKKEREGATKRGRG